MSEDGDAGRAIGLTVRQLRAADAAEWRRLRLQALAADPTAFGVSLHEEQARTLAETAAGLAAPPPDATFGAFAGATLVGGVGFVVPTLAKMRHKGVLVALFVEGRMRKRGLARALVDAVLEHARAHVEIVQVSVVVGNTPARALYLGLGFTPFALEPCGLKVDGRCYDEERLYRRLEPDA